MPTQKSHQEIAHFIGLARSTVSTAIKRLVKEGFVIDENGLKTSQEWATAVTLKSGQKMTKQSENDQNGQKLTSTPYIYKEDITANAVIEIIDKEPEKPRAKDNHTKEYDKLIKWLRDLTGAPLINKAKQYVHLRKAREADISPTRLKNRATELWEKPFYRENGMDWGGVVSSFDKKA